MYVVSVAILLAFSVAGYADEQTGGNELLRILNIANQQKQLIKLCNIPNEAQSGVCVEVGKCAAYLKLRNVDKIVSEQVNFLKKVQCDQSLKDEDKLEPRVCCPASGMDYLNPFISFTKVEYGRLLNVTARFKHKKLKRRIQIVEAPEGLNYWNECGKQASQRIYGGEIAELDEFPWMALLIYKSEEFGCSGALVGNRHVLTAAHCVHGEGVRDKGGLKVVRLGEFNVKTEPDCIEEPNFLSCADAAVDVGINKIYVHPEYEEYSLNKYNDIAIIRLKYDVEFSHFIMPICLPNENQAHPFRNGELFSVSGWGRTDLFRPYYKHIHSPIKLKLRIPWVPQEVCSAMLHPLGVTVGKKQICAGGEFAKDTCAGDSGGPLMFFDRNHSRWVSYGIVSYGFTKCGMAGHPAVYTNVVEYMDWIRSIINL